MNPLESRGPRPGWKERLLERLHHPGQLRVAVTALALLAGYLGIYVPLSGEISATTRDLALERRRLELAREIEQLRAQRARFQQRLADKPDPNEWVQYVLAGLRQFPVEMKALDRDPPRPVGPYQAVALRIELEGGFADLTAFLRWLETNERLFRVEAVKMTPHRRNNGTLVMQLTVLGLMG
jgi:hypothetical protein